MTMPLSRRACWSLLVCGLLVACADDPSTGDPSIGDPSATTEVPAPATDDTSPADPGSSTGGVQPEGFTTVTARITEDDGEVCEVCLWLADSVEERGRGLMGVTDLGDAAGMAFVFDEPVQGGFLMYQTPTPLSIAWFAPDGSLVSRADMAPCLDMAYDECPRYRPEQPYDLAIEVFDDGSGDALAALGIGPGARVELLPGTEAPECDTPASPSST